MAIQQWQQGSPDPFVEQSGSPALVGGAGGGGGGASAVTMPALSAFTFVNQGPATAVQTVAGGPILLTIPDNASQNFRLLTQAIPSAPCKLILQLRCLRMQAANSQTAGAYFYDGTKLLCLEFLSQANGVQPAIFRQNDVFGSGRSQVTSDNFAQEPAQTLNPFADAVFIQLRYDGTNLYFDFSADGTNFTAFYSEPMTTFLHPVAFGFGGLSVTGTAAQYVAISCLSFLLGTDANLNG